VRLGLADARFVEVLAGLRPGDRVLAQQQSAGAGQGP